MPPRGKKGVITLQLRDLQRELGHGDEFDTQSRGLERQFPRDRNDRRGDDRGFRDQDYGNNVDDVDDWRRGQGDTAPMRPQGRPTDRSPDLERIERSDEKEVGSGPWRRSNAAPTPSTSAPRAYVPPRGGDFGSNRDGRDGGRDGRDSGRDGRDGESTEDWGMVRNRSSQGPDPTAPWNQGPRSTGARGKEDPLPGPVKSGETGPRAAPTVAPWKASFRSPETDSVSEKPKTDALPSPNVTSSDEKLSATAVEKPPEVKAPKPRTDLFGRDTDKPASTEPPTAKSATPATTVKAAPYRPPGAAERSAAADTSAPLRTALPETSSGAYRPPRPGAERTAGGLTGPPDSLGRQAVQKLAAASKAAEKKPKKTESPEKLEQEARRKQKQETLESASRRKQQRMTAIPAAMEKLEGVLESALSGGSSSLEELQSIIGDEHKASVIPLFVAARTIMCHLLRLRSPPEEPLSNSGVVSTRIKNCAPSLNALFENATDLDSPALCFLYETQRVTHTLGCPRLSAEWSLVEAAWNEFYIQGVISTDIFLRWHEAPSEFDAVPGWNTVLLQMKPWFDWLTKKPLDMIQHDPDDDDKASDEDAKSESSDESEPALEA